MKKPTGRDWLPLAGTERQPVEAPTGGGGECRQDLADAASSLDQTHLFLDELMYSFSDGVAHFAHLGHDLSIGTSESRGVWVGPHHPLGAPREDRATISRFFRAYGNNEVIEPALFQER